MAATHQSFIHHEIKDRLNQGNVYYSSVPSHLRFYASFKTQTIKIYKIITVGPSV